jgi:hypothetical protein
MITLQRDTSRETFYVIGRGEVHIYNVICEPFTPRSELSKIRGSVVDGRVVKAIECFGTPYITKNESIGILFE